MLISVVVRSASAKAPLVEQQDDGSYLIHVKSRAIEGEANKELVRTLAKHFGVQKTSISIKTGHSARIKRVLIGN